MALTNLQDSHAWVTQVAPYSLVFPQWNQSDWYVSFGNDRLVGYNITPDTLAAKGFGAGSKGETLSVSLHPDLYVETNIRPGSFGGPPIAGPLEIFLRSDDNFEGLADGQNVAYLGYGFDKLTGGSAADTLFGGSDSDTVIGGGGDDLLFGDGRNIPTELYWNSSPDDDPRSYGAQPHLGAPEYWDPAFFAAYDTYAVGTFDVDIAESGDDLLRGGTGADKLWGGAGSDQLDAGPRGTSSPDFAFGGPDADIFYVGYDSVNSVETNWFASHQTEIGSVAGDAVKSVVSGIAKAALEKTLGGFVTGLLGGTIASVLGNTTKSGIASLLDATSAQTPINSATDKLIIGDFDPREDVLFLPRATGVSVTAQASAGDPDAIPYLATAGLSSNIKVQLTDGNAVFAEIWLAKDFIDDTGAAGLNNVGIGLAENFFNTSMTFNADGSIVDATNTGTGLGTQAIDRLTDPNNFTSGTTDVVNLESFGWSTPSGVASSIYGAFARPRSTAWPPMSAAPISATS